MPSKCSFPAPCLSDIYLSNGRKTRSAYELLNFIQHVREAVVVGSYMLTLHGSNTGTFNKIFSISPRSDNTHSPSDTYGSGKSCSRLNKNAASGRVVSISCYVSIIWRSSRAKSIIVNQESRWADRSLPRTFLSQLSHSLGYIFTGQLFFGGWNLPFRSLETYLFIHWSGSIFTYSTFQRGFNPAPKSMLQLKKWRLGFTWSGCWADLANGEWCGSGGGGACWVGLFEPKCMWWGHFYCWDILWCNVLYIKVKK